MGIRKTLSKLEEIVRDQSMDWDGKFDLIFSDHISIKILAFSRKHGVTLDWYDPDTSYEEDVMAFYNAVISVRDELLSKTKKGNLRETQAIE